MSPMPSPFCCNEAMQLMASCRLLVVRMGFGFTSAPGANERKTCLFQPRP
jgi:hypothetical protein